MNAKRNCYVGFLAGVGYTVDTETKAGKPIYPEYDAEVDFDVRYLIISLFVKLFFNKVICQFLRYEGNVILNFANFVLKIGSIY